MARPHASCVDCAASQVVTTAVVPFSGDGGGDVYARLHIVGLVDLLFTSKAGQVAIDFEKLANAALTTRGARWLVHDAVRRGNVRLLQWAIGGEVTGSVAAVKAALQTRSPECKLQVAVSPPSQSPCSRAPPRSALSPPLGGPLTRRGWHLCMVVRCAGHRRPHKPDVHDWPRP